MCLSCTHALLDLSLQLRQQIQCLQGRQPVQIHFALLLQHRLRQGSKDRQLCRTLGLGAGR